MLRIATREKTEYQLWMTRRFVRVMCGALIQTMEKNPEMAADLLPDVKDAVLAIEHHE